MQSLFASNFDHNLAYWVYAPSLSLEMHYKIIKSEIKSTKAMTMIQNMLVFEKTYSFHNTNQHRFLSLSSSMNFHMSFHISTRFESFLAMITFKWSLLYEHEHEFLNAILKCLDNHNDYI